jgi:uracil-DNA glycosylase family 4
LAEFRQTNRAEHLGFYNGPVPSFGSLDAPLLIVGLAPGLKGANRTGRPFTGDYAGELLYGSLARHGLTRGSYQAKPDDGFELVGTRITNAVRCVPPENKPTAAEIGTCRPFLASRIAGMPRLAVLLALGRIAHDSTLAALEARRSAFPFAHGARHEVRSGLTLFDSYHCSRYNTNTGRLTSGMFRAVLQAIRDHLGPA